jgi:tetratricopeptide (TPR) repeat protein
MPVKGDSIIVVSEPASEYSDYCISKVLAVNPDPFFEKIIIIETPFEVDRSQGLVLNMNGELAGFMTSIKVPGTNLNFAIPSTCLCRYYCHGRYDAGRFSHEYKDREQHCDNYLVGQVNLWLGNYVRARTYFEEARREDGYDDPRIITYLAFIEWKTGNDEKAEEYFELAIKRQGDFDDAHYVYGLFLKRQERLEEAEKEFKKAIHNNKYHAMARYELGRLYVEEDKIEDAMDEYEDLKKLDQALADKMLGH